MSTDAGSPVEGATSGEREPGQRLTLTRPVGRSLLDARVGLWLIGASGSGRVTVHDRAEEVEVSVDLHGETRVHQRIHVGLRPDWKVRRIRRLGRFIEAQRDDQEHMPEWVVLCTGRAGQGIEHMVVEVGEVDPVPLVVAGVALRRCRPKQMIGGIDDLVKVGRRMDSGGARGLPYGGMA